LIKALLMATAALALAACASTPRGVSHPPERALEEIAPTAQAAPDPRILIVDSATAMIGQPYRYGGSSPGGFDCSGLVVYAAAGAGIRVPRTALDQLNFGQPVGRAELQAGDLVFMHLSSKELHVAIALDHERFVHAPSSGGFVRIDSLAAAPYARGFIGARRVVSSITRP
jgi:cell wall-associated NlpC family hydrolase